MVEIFLIAGCQRTGTTLMRMILESHSMIRCFDETLAYSALAKEEYAAPSNAKLIGLKIPRWTEQLTEPTLRDLGLDVECPNFYRGQKIIFLLRNVKDTVASMVKLKFGTESWLETWGKPILDWKIQQNDKFRMRFHDEIEKLKSSPEQLVAAGALYWKYKTLSYFDYCNKRFRVHGVRYETLVTNPEPVLQSVCGFLGVPWERQLLNHAQLPHGELSKNGLAIGNTDPLKPIHRESVGQWKRFFNDLQASEIMRIAGDVETLLERIDLLSLPESRPEPD